MVAFPALLLAASAATGCLGTPVSGVQRPSSGPTAAPDTISYVGLYRNGISFAQFMEAADARRETWEGNFARAVVAPALQKRAAAAGPLRVLVVAEDWCGDSANTIPYLARLVEGTPALELRIVDSEVGRAVMEAHQTPDGRAATPTVVLLDPSDRLVGCWSERPATLQTWYLDNQAKLSRDELLRQKYAWYDEDRGASTLRDIVDLMEQNRGLPPPSCEQL